MRKIKKYLVLLLLVFFGFLYQSKYIHDFPSHIHAWAQADRYALSLGFLDNGLNFFKPQTFVYNHQFPDDWQMPAEKTITAVDFPIHDYVPALIMKVTGNTSPFVFRVYVLLYSLFGLFFLFKLAYAISNHYLKSVFVVVFAATSPVYVYYQANFLPTIPSLSNAIIGIYFYYKYLNESRNKHFVLSILFLTLAALARTTFAIPLIAGLGTECIRILKHKTNLRPKLIPVFISLASIISYFLYNTHLSKTYGSIFLNHLMLPHSIAEAKEIIEVVYDNWFFQYFTQAHYLAFILFALFAAFFILKQGFKKVKTYFGLFAITYFFGCIAFAVLMLEQFPAHDYYFLDTFFFPLILFFIFILSLIPFPDQKVFKAISIIALCAVGVFLIAQPVKSQEQRRETGYWDKTEITCNNYSNSAKFLDSIGIPKDAKLLVIDAVAPNLPFILMNRKGFAVMSSEKKMMEDALNWDYDYIVLQNEFFVSDVYTPNPTILLKLNKIADNGKISVCTRSENNPQSLLDFMGLNKQTPVFQNHVSFETEPDTLWENFNPSGKFSFSGSSSGCLTPDVVYGLTYKSRFLPELTSASRTLLFSAYFLRDTIVTCDIVVSINANEKNIYYKSYNLENLIKQQGTWEKICLLFQLPKIENKDYEFAIFINNPSKSELYYDDFGFSIY